MKILFLHGWNSVPGGVKRTYLKDHGHEAINPALPHEDFAQAVPIAQAEFDQHGAARTVKPGTVILHSRADDVVPFADSEEPAKTSGATLIGVGTDHRLADPEPLAAMLRACENR